MISIALNGKMMNIKLTKDEWEFLKLILDRETGEFDILFDMDRFVYSKTHDSFFEKLGSSWKDDIIKCDENDHLWAWMPKDQSICMSCGILRNKEND